MKRCLFLGLGSNYQFPLDLFGLCMMKIESSNKIGL